MKNSIMPPRTILIANLRLIGDVILTTPLIGILHAAYPEAAIDLLVNVKTGEFLEKDPRVRQVIYSEAIDVDRNEKTQGGKGYIGRIMRRYDMAISLSASDRSNIAVLLAGRQVRVGFYLPVSGLKSLWQRLFFTHPLPFSQERHVVRLCQEVAEALGIPVQRLDVRIFWDEADALKVTDTLQKNGVTNGFFVIHPFARWRYKFWDMERFVALSDRLAGEYQLQPVWTSSPHPDEVAQLQESVAACRVPPVTIAGGFTLNQMASLLARATLYVGLDTAISHLAATTGIPMVALFGPTPATRWGPWDNQTALEDVYLAGKGRRRSGNIVLLQSERDCVPCGKMGCVDKYHDSECLQAITLAEVLEGVAELLPGERKVQS